MVIDSVKIVRLDLTTYPFKVEAMDENRRLLRTFIFNRRDEAIMACNEMNFEILKHHKKV